MQFKTLFATSLVAGLAFAIPQGTAADGSMTPAQSVAADQLCMGMKTWVVNVSDTTDALKFSPNNIKAAAGECVQFQFWPKNHSVVQGDFANPCQPTTQQNAFYSGFMPVEGATAGKLTYTIKVADTNPKWFYCSQGKHCQSGMVGAINAPDTGNTVAAFAAAAAKAQTNTSPGSAGSAAASSGTPAATSTGAVGAQNSAAAAPRLVEAARNGAWGMGLSAVAALFFF